MTSLQTFQPCTGRHRRIREENEREAYLAWERDQAARDALVFEQLGERKVLQARVERLKHFAVGRKADLNADRDQYQKIRRRDREVFTPTQAQRKTRSGPASGARWR